MDRTTKKRTTRDLLAKLGLGGLVLAVVLSSPSAFAQQTQPDQNSSAPQAQQQQQAPPPDQNGNPPQAQDQQPAQQPDHRGAASRLADASDPQVGRVDGQRISGTHHVH